jgi:hypothetical protein
LASVFITLERSCQFATIPVRLFNLYGKAADLAVASETLVGTHGGWQ